jgi:hypothetical protein
MRRVIPRPKVLLLPEKTSSMKQADLRGKFKKVTDNVCTSTVLIPPDPLSLTPLNSLEDTEEDPKWADGDI